ACTPCGGAFCHEHADPPELEPRPFDHGLHFVGVADVAPQSERTHPELAEIAGRPLAALELTGAEHEVGTQLGEPLRHLPSDPAAAAGDDCDLAGQVEELGRLQRSNSAIVRSVSRSRVWTSSVVTPDSRHAPRRSAIRSRGPTRQSSSTSASGTAAAASRCLPPRYSSLIAAASA